MQSNKYGHKLDYMLNTLAMFSIYLKHMHNKHFSIVQLFFTGLQLFF